MYCMVRLSYFYNTTKYGDQELPPVITADSLGSQEPGPGQLSLEKGLYSWTGNHGHDSYAEETVFRDEVLGALTDMCNKVI